MDATADQLNAIKEHFEAGVELTEEELDIVADASIEVVRDILKLFGEASCTIDEYEGDEGELILDVSDGDLAVLIGRHGKTLDALQVLVSSLDNNKLGFHYPVVVDITLRVYVNEFAEAAANAFLNVPMTPRLPKSCATSLHAWNTASGDSLLADWRFVPVPTR